MLSVHYSIYSIDVSLRFELDLVALHLPSASTPLRKPDRQVQFPSARLVRDNSYAHPKKAHGAQAHRLTREPRCQNGLDVVGNRLANLI